MIFKFYYKIITFYTISNITKEIVFHFISIEKMKKIHLIQ